MEQQPSRLRSVITSVFGFWLGGLLGIIAIFLIAISGFLGWVLGFVPPGQSFVRLLAAVLLVFIIVGIGGAVTGVFNGLVLQRIDRQGGRRLLLGAGYAYGIGQGTLIMPMLLLISLISLYNNGSPGEPLAYLLLFGFLCLVYGLLIGLIFSLLTINFKRMWGVLLAVVAGYTLRGVLLGLLLWRADLVSSGIVPLRVILRLLLISLLIDLPVGIFVGLAFHNLAQKRERLDEAALQPGRIQRFIVIGVSLVVLFLVLGVIRNADTFLTINPAATAIDTYQQMFEYYWEQAIPLQDADWANVN
jgi:hypothetical protein